LWLVCGWSVIVALGSVFLIASYSFSPGLSMFGVIVLLIAFATFFVTMCIGLMLLVFKL